MSLAMIHPDGVLFTRYTRDTDGGWRVYIASENRNLHTHLPAEADVPGDWGPAHNTGIVPRTAFCLCPEDPS